MATSNGGGFHLKAETSMTRTMTAKVQTGFIVKRCKEAINNQPVRISCLETNTCATMRSMWTEVTNYPEMAIVFTVSYDSHSLQLLLGDILEWLFLS